MAAVKAINFILFSYATKQTETLQVLISRKKLYKLQMLLWIPQKMLQYQLP